MADLATIKFGAVPFREAIEALRELLAMDADTFNALSAVQKARAFSFADATTTAAAQAAQRVLEGVLRGEIGRDQFGDRLNAALDAYGIAESSHQIDTIFETNLAKVYADGKERQYANTEFRARFPYVGLVTARDNRVRHNHYALDYRRIGTVFRHDDFIWSVMNPPLGFRCRCTKIAFSEAMVAAQGLQIGRGEEWFGKPVEVTVPGGFTRVVQVIPDTGFGVGPLTARELARQALVALAICNAPIEFPAPIEVAA